MRLPCAGTITCLISSGAPSLRMRFPISATASRATPFQSPFASPPGEGLSSSTVNVLWGLLNLAIAYLLVCRVGKFELRRTRHVLMLGAGILVMSLMLAHTFGRLHGGLR